MAKRFITTDIFDDPWFMDLPGKYKLFYLFVLTRCDHAGLWMVNFKAAAFYVGEHLEPAECERFLRDRIVAVNENKYWFIPKFVKVQYGENLCEKNKAHLSVINTLKKFNLHRFIPDSASSFSDDSDYQSSDSNVDKSHEMLISDKEMLITEKNKALLSGIDAPKDKVKDKDEVKDKVEVKVRDKVGVMRESGTSVTNHDLLFSWIGENAPRVNKLKHPVTKSQCEKLLQEFDEGLVKEVLLAMENHKKLLCSYESAYLTLRQWIKRRIDSGGEKFNKVKFKGSIDDTPRLNVKYYDPLEEMKNGNL